MTPVVTINTTWGHRSEEVPVQVRGHVVNRFVRPWGTDIVIKLDAPALVGHPDHEPTEYLCVSESRVVVS